MLLEHVRLWTIAIVLATVPLACSSPQDRSPTPGGNTELGSLFEEFLRGYLAWRPQTAVSLGLHQYDGMSTDFSQPSIDAELRRLKDFEQRLAELESRDQGSMEKLDVVLARHC